MLRRVSVGEAEVHLADLLKEITDCEASIVIEREGRPIAALVSVDRLDVVPTDENQGTLAVVGIGEGPSDEAIDKMIADLYAARDRDISRPVDLGA